MKTKLFIALTIAATVLVGCQPTLQLFEISGTFDEALNVPDSTLITLTYANYKQDGKDFTLKAYTHNSTFKIKGKAEKPELAVLALREYGDDVIIALESGSIEVNVAVVEDDDEQSIVVTTSGTPQNKKIADYEIKMDAFWNKYFETDPEERDALEDEYYQIANTYLEDINSLSGQYVFIQNFSNLELDQLEKLFAQMNDDIKQEGTIAVIYQQYVLLTQTGKGTHYIDFSATTPDGNTLALSDLVGTKPYILVDFWASWCGPCRRAMPQLKQIYEQYNNKLEILGVSLDNNEEQWKNAIDAMQINWKHISDLQGWQAEAAQIYGINAIPATVLIDKNGTIVGRNLSAEDLIQILKL